MADEEHNGSFAYNRSVSTYLAGAFGSERRHEIEKVWPAAHLIRDALFLETDVRYSMLRSCSNLEVFSSFPDPRNHTMHGTIPIPILPKSLRTKSARFVYKPKIA